MVIESIIQSIKSGETQPIDDIRQVLEILFKSGDVAELRMPKAQYGKVTIAGYFNDFNALTHSAEEYNGKVPALYVTLNKINPALLSRSANRITIGAENTTSDNDVIRRAWLPIDIDAKRPAGISSTDEEHDYAIKKAYEIAELLKSEGWGEPIIADSGNGAGVLYKIDLPNTPEITEMLKKYLEALAYRFSDEKAEVDLKVFNAARIWKLYGTIARKGDNTKERPHRKSKILSNPNTMAIISKEQILNIINWLPVIEPAHQQQSTKKTFNLQNFLAKYNIGVRNSKAWNGQTIHILNECPFDSNHKDARVIEMNSGAVAFGCFHNSCAGKKWKEFREYFEPNAYEKKKECPQKRNELKELNSDDGKVCIHLPQKGKLISIFANEVAEVLKDKYILFYRSDSHEIVEITKNKQKKDVDDGFTGFQSIRPHRFVTLVEEYITPYNIYEGGRGNVIEEEKSMGSDLANTLLCSPNMQDNLPIISRIFTVPIPIIYNGQLSFPKKGYDGRFLSWLPNDAPSISNEEMALNEAKEIIETLMSEFCFQSKQDKIIAIAALLTPFLRGLYSSFNVRTPVFFYLANRERAGKDYLAGITGILYEGYALEEAPISTSETAKNNNTEELEKIIMSALIGGRKRMHFANNRGYINNANFEAIITNRKHSGRILGRNELAVFDNELELSLSGNVGVGFTPDLANRCRFVRLFLDIEDANARNFKNPNLHGWIEQNRGLILSALYAWVRNWIECGKIVGTKPFASFSEWADVCGGIMEAAGYASPCEPDKETSGIGGDSETSDMKQLFEVCFGLYPDKYLSKNEIREIISNDDNNLFGYLDFSKKSDQIKFGHKIMKFVGRVLSDIRMVVQDGSVRAARQKYMFTKNKQTSLNEIKEPKSGNVGNLGNISTQVKETGKNMLIEVKHYPTLPALPTQLNSSKFASLINFINTHLDADGLCAICEIIDESTGFTIEMVDLGKQEGLIFEPRCGFVKVI